MSKKSPLLSRVNCERENRAISWISAIVLTVVIVGFVAHHFGG